MSVTSGGRPAFRAALGETAANDRAGEGLARLELLAEALQRRAEPVRFARARTDAEREAIFRLRYQVVVERGWAAAETMPDGLESDADDEAAEFVAGWDGDHLVACARLIFPAVGRRLPVERIFDLTVEPVGRVVHIDRVVVARSHSDPGHRVLAGLIARCWQESATRGYEVAAGIDSRATLRLYRLIGVAATVLGPPRTYWNEERFPVRFDVGQSLSDLLAHWTRMAAPLALEAS